MDAEVVHGTDRRPKDGEGRADQALDIAPLLAVIPKADVHELQADDTGDIFDSCHAQGHAREQQQLLPHRIHTVFFTDGGQQIKNTEARTVQGHIGPHAEAGVDPLTLRVCAGEKPAVQQLSHPSKGGANEE